MILFTGKKNNEKRGFSLIEAFVAIAVLTISIAGPMTLAHRGLITANVAKDQVTAFFLGQEAVEYIRYVRDSNVLNLLEPSWLKDLSDCIGSVCRVDSIDGEIEECGGTGQCANLRRESTQGLYGYNPNPTWEDTFFNREFTLTWVAPNEISIDVIVSWKFGVLTRSITIRENLFNWQ